MRLEKREYEVVPVHPLFGAEIRGIDIQEPLSSDVSRDISALLVEKKVLFFRNQSVSRQQHIDFASYFGNVHIFSSDDTECLEAQGYPEILPVSSDPRAPGGGVITNCWHTDGSFYQKPFLASMLHAVEIPELGGDTLFVDMHAAYEGLPDKVKQEIENLTAVHNAFLPYIPRADKDQHDFFQITYPPCEHPVVKVHPDTGKKILFVNELYTSHIQGLADEVSRSMLQMLFSQCRIPEYQIRFKWDKDSIAIWDNRSTQHYASLDYRPANRYMEVVFIEQP